MQFVSLINPADAIRAIDRIIDKRKDAISIHNSSFMTGLYYELSGLYQTENCLTILAALDILKNLDMKSVIKITIPDSLMYAR